MTKDALRRYIRSPVWRARRRRYHATHPRACWACGSTNTVQLHHLAYDRIGSEPDSDLKPLCRKHHRQAHAAVRAGKCTLARSAWHVRAKVERRKTVKTRRKRRKAA